MFDAQSVYGCDCSSCPLRDTHGTLRPAAVPAGRQPSLLLIGEAPGFQDLSMRAQFAGREGEVLDAALEYLGHSRRDVYLGFVVLCRPPRKLSPAEWRKALTCCRPQLDATLSEFSRVPVVAFDKWALASFTDHENIYAWAGSPLPHETQNWVLGTLGPGVSVRKEGWPYRPVLYIHLERAFKLCEGRLGAWGWPVIHISPGPAMVKALQNIFEAGLPVGFDVETQGVDPLTSTVMCMAVANKDVAVSIPWAQYFSKNQCVQGLESYEHGPEIGRLFAKILKSKTIEKWCQNGIHDLATAHALGLTVNNYTFDTMLAHNVVAQGRKHDLGWIACEEYHAPRWKEEKHTASNEKGAAKFANRLPEELKTYNAKDAYMTCILGYKLKERVATSPGAASVLASYMDNTRIALKMLIRGLRQDKQMRDKHRPRILANRARARREVRMIAEKFWPDTFKKFNPSSGRAIDELVRKKLGAQATKYSQKTGDPSWDEEALSRLVADSNQLVSMAARALLRYRRWSTLLKYTEIAHDEEGLIHVTWKPAGAKTMRWASSPNMQNIPPKMRDMFVPYRKDGWIVKADYEQLELRIATLFSGAKKLMAAFEAGLDTHWLNAELMFGKMICEEAKKQKAAGKGDLFKELRNMAKMGAYQMMYGGAPESLWKTLILDYPNMTLRQCLSIHSKWFDANYEIREMHEKWMASALKNRYIEAPLSGHRYYFFGAAEPSFVYNYPVQHTGADIINPAIGPVCKALNWTTESLMAQIHDELMLEGLDPVK
jgi:uracil-DNA glycosylase family 4